MGYGFNQLGSGGGGGLKCDKLWEMSSTSEIAKYSTKTVTLEKPITDYDGIFIIYINATNYVVANGIYGPSRFEIAGFTKKHQASYIQGFYPKLTHEISNYNSDIYRLITVNSSSPYKITFGVPKQGSSETSDTYVAIPVGIYGFKLSDLPSDIYSEIMSVEGW